MRDVLIQPMTEWTSKSVDQLKPINPALLSKIEPCFAL